MTARIIARGSVLGRYEILGAIGSGARADVWLGRATEDGGLARPLAIRTARPGLVADPGQRATFLRQGAIAAAIRHANVVEVIDAGEVGGVLYQVMALAEGGSLARLVARAVEVTGAPLPVAVTLGIAVDALRGLHALHEGVDASGGAGGVVPRGVSARSILVGLDGVARVSDFGTARADVLAMGIVLWEALTGVRLREGGEACATLDDVPASPVVDPRTHVKELPAAIVEVVMRALAPAPESRHASAEAMAEALTEAAREARLGLDRREIARAVSALAVSRTRDAAGEASGADPTPTVVTDTTARARPRLAVRILPVVVLAAVAALTLAIPLLR